MAQARATQVTDEIDEAGAGPGPSLCTLIGLDIVSGAYAPESRLPDEQAMRARYGVSRTALREAYSKLGAKGLIRARPRIGTSVRPRAEWNMLDADVLDWHLRTQPPGALAEDLYRLRRMIEPGASELAARAARREHVAAIHEALGQMRAAIDDEEALVEADLRFHVAILRASGNPFLGAFSALIRAAMISNLRLSWRGAAPRRAERIAQHEGIAEAIRAGRDREAGRRMAELLDQSLCDVREQLTRRP